MVDRCIALSAGGGYIHITPAGYKCQKIEPDLKKLFIDEAPSKLLWAAFGPNRNNCFVSSIDKAGEHQIVTDTVGTPEQLREWIEEPGCNDQHIRVSLGPMGSFFAWTSTRVRWHNIPDGLQEVVQSWLGPTGWNSGPPRIVSLGPGRSFFAISEYGSSAWSIPSALTSKHAGMKALDTQLEAMQSELDSIEVMSISCGDVGSWVLLKKDLSYMGCLQDWESFDASLGAMLNAGEAQQRKENRQREKAKEVRGEKTKMDEKRRPREQKKEEEQLKKEKLLRKKRQDEQAKDLASQYHLWQTAWEDDFVKKKVLTTFPHFPVRVLFCKDVSCISFKEEPGSLRACSHDVERFFRASGKYEQAWLKKQRLMWHPDRFGLRCDPDYRKELKRKAEQLYQIFETLMVQEAGSEGE